MNSWLGGVIAMRKRDLQADVIAAWALVHAGRYGIDHAYVRTREVMALFDCSRSTASRIMDYCELRNPLLTVDGVYIGAGTYGKCVVADVEGLKRVPVGAWHEVWVNAHRARRQLGVSYATLDSIKALAGAAYDSTA